ncbi:MAG TPA: hypothetical protein VFP59_14345 [Candidatus Angelobacter sp.]|nr:hypothetical protein [Candidatus Angelobacter sp.]
MKSSDDWSRDFSHSCCALVQRNLANGGLVQRAKGCDIAFTSDAVGQSLLDSEIDSYDPITGNAAFWVRIPILSPAVDTSF